MYLLCLCTCKHFRNRRVLRVFSRTTLWLWIELDHIRLLVNREHLRPVAHQHSKHHLELSLIMNKLRCIELLEVLLFALLEESIQKNLQINLTILNFTWIWNECLWTQPCSTRTFWTAKGSCTGRRGPRSCTCIWSSFLSLKLRPTGRHSELDLHLLLCLLLYDKQLSIVLNKITNQFNINFSYLKAEIIYFKRLTKQWL